MSDTFLIVDDSKTIQKVIKIAFAPYSVNLLTANTLDQAKVMIPKNPPSLILVDATIPGSNGAQDLATLHSLADGCPVVVLVGSYDAIDESEFSTVGLNDILRKPFESNELIDRVQLILNRPMGIASPGESTSEQDDQTTFLNLEFDDSEATATSAKRPPILEAPSPPPRQTPKKTPDIPKPKPRSNSNSGLIEPFLNDEMAKIIRKTVEEYCLKHFPNLAKDVITAEIRRLTDEKASHLIDK